MGTSGLGASSRPGLRMSAQAATTTTATVGPITAAAAGPIEPCFIVKEIMDHAPALNRPFLSSLPKTMKDREKKKMFFVVGTSVLEGEDKFIETLKMVEEAAIDLKIKQGESNPAKRKEGLGINIIS